MKKNTKASSNKTQWQSLVISKSENENQSAAEETWKEGFCYLLWMFVSFGCIIAWIIGLIISFLNDFYGIYLKYTFSPILVICSISCLLVLISKLSSSVFSTSHEGRFDNFLIFLAVILIFIWFIGLFLSIYLGQKNQFLDLSIIISLPVFITSIILININEVAEWVLYSIIAPIFAFLILTVILTLLSIPICIFPVTYIMCAIRWFTADHFYFWDGFKELIWALCPILNVAYVWDWWVFAFHFVF